MTDSPNQPDSDLLLKITACQSKIFALAVSLLGDRDAAADIQQETNLVIWGKAEEAREVKNFSAWAMKIAFYEIKNYRRRQQRSSLIFDTDVMEILAEESMDLVDSMDDRLSALQECMKRLPERQRDLLDERYHDGTTVKTIAKRLSRPANQIGVLLFRIRAELHNCITLRMKEGKV